MHIVMTVKNRHLLTYQALTSLYRNTVGPWHLVIVDDGSAEDIQSMLATFQLVHPRHIFIARVAPSHPDAGILGKLKNTGVGMAQNVFPGSQWLYLSDNDVYFTLGWDKTLQSAAEATEKEGFRLWGGQNHPYHRPVATIPVHDRLVVHEYGAVAGTSWLMRPETWTEYGPLDGNAKGTGQSEDTAFCQRITRAGYRVGAVEPQVVIDTGITQTDGTPSVGAEFKQRVPGVTYL